MTRPRLVKPDGANTRMHLPSRSGYMGFRVIGFLKLASGLLALVLGLVFVRFVSRDPASPSTRGAPTWASIRITTLSIASSRR